MKIQTDRRTPDGRTHGYTDSLRDTIIPRHYHVAGKKKMKQYYSAIIVLWGDNLQTLMKYTQKQSQFRSPQYQCIYPVGWKFVDIYSLLSWNENMDVSQAGNSVKNWWHLPISNPEPDLHDSNAHNEFGEN